MNQFNSSAEVSNFAYNNWNGSPGSVAFSASDGLNNPQSGSMQMSITYGPSGTNGCSFISTAAPMPVNLANAAYIEFDLKVDAASPLDPNGNAYYFQIGFNSPGFVKVAEFWLGPWGKPFTPGVWQHFKLPLESALPNGNVSQLFINPYDANFTTTQTVVTYIDNIVFDPLAVFPNFAGFTFDTAPTVGSNAVAGMTGGGPGTATGGGWYGQPCTITWDSNQNSTIGNPSITNVLGSGAAYIVAQYTNAAGDNADIIGLGFDTNWGGGLAGFPTDTNVVIDGTHYYQVELDVKWDTNNSTMSLAGFNAQGDVTGFPIGLMYNPNAGQVEAMGNATPGIPNAASNGWVHMVIPIIKTSPGIDQTMGLWFKKYGNGGTLGTAAYWIDNVVFDGGPSAVVQPTMAISKPTLGLNQVASGTGGNPPYDRESLVTFAFNYSFVDQASPVSYSMNIAKFPSAALYPNYLARIMLVPNSAATEAEADWNEPTLACLVIQYVNTNDAQVTIQCKTNSPSSNGSLFTQNSVTVFSNTPVTGNWTFTFTQNTNIQVTSPTGSSTNLPFPLGLNSSGVSSVMGGGSMVVYFGSMNNSANNEGQRVVLKSAGITNGPTTLLWDDFTKDTTINLGPGGPWLIASDAAAALQPWSLYLTQPTDWYYVDWTSPANGFTLETNNVLSLTGWSTNTPITTVFLASHYHAEVTASNTPPTTPVYFRVANPGP